MNVPKLRFKEFTEEWKKVELDKLYEFKNGLNGDRSLYGKGVKLINVSDILNNTYITSKVINGKININEDTLRKNSVEYGDILFQRSSETFLEIGTSNVYLDNKLVAFSGFVIRGKRKKDNINNPLFINYELKSPTLRKKIIICGSGAQHFNIGQEDLKRIIIFLPSIQEQRKIADMLELLDKKIELQTKKIEVLKLFKKGLNQRMFSKTGEFKSISKYVEEYTNKTIVNNQYPILSSTFNGIVIQNEYFNKQAASSKNIGYKIVPRSYITYRSMSDTGEFHFNIQDKVDIGIVSPAYPVFKINNINVNYFLNYINESYDFKMQIISIKEGGTRYALGFNKFKKLKIKIIDDDEFYGDFIKKLNEYLLLEDKKLDDLNKLKKGFMQNMFI